MKIGVPGLVVRIDESLVHGKRKHNNGRSWLGDGKFDYEPEEDEESSDEDDLVK